MTSKSGCEAEKKGSVEQMKYELIKMRNEQLQKPHEDEEQKLKSREDALRRAANKSTDS